MSYNLQGLSKSQGQELTQAFAAVNLRERDNVARKYEFPKFDNI
jgi:hypothetical protein